MKSNERSFLCGARTGPVLREARTGPVVPEALPNVRTLYVHLLAALERHLLPGTPVECTYVFVCTLAQPPPSGSLLTHPVRGRAYVWVMSNPAKNSTQKAQQAGSQAAPQRAGEPKVLLHYHPWSRAAGVRWLLEELGVPYDLHFVNLHAPGGVPESYRAIHPHKKVPAVEIDGQILTERAAITIDLADRFPQAGLAPAIGDPLRSAYLRMLVYCDSVYDPCVAAKVHGLQYAPGDYSFGGYDDMLRNVQKHLAQHDYAAGDRFTAADTQLGSSLAFTIHVLSAVPLLPEFEAYLARVTERPAYLRAKELDAALMKSQGVAPGAAAE